ncbi:MAG: hypothetical protein CFH06_01203 [Alphaproteobacteria bacterium MarineAlpha3_Bin5]|nr:hypothetical protein [Magnetovibrio sp.]PPR77568.1 MAG: hypothetical protein CFH06_01203 [Alphaproteobacteria bacterium MarineAlpha3_Bin5]|tara:strand:+ start:192 stop:503 length:312 start_codon:yes stop_codon:yes gene_type:complete
MRIFGSVKNDVGSEDRKMNNITLSSGKSYQIAVEVDCLGDSCPRPQLMTKKTVEKARSMDVIQVSIDNPTSMEAIPPMCPAIQATHLETVKVDRHWNIYIQKN